MPWVLAVGCRGCLPWVAVEIAVEITVDLAVEIAVEIAVASAIDGPPRCSATYGGIPWKPMECP